MEYLLGAGALGMAITALVYCHKWGTASVSGKVTELDAKQSRRAYEDQKALTKDSDERYEAAVEDLEDQLESVHALIAQAAENGGDPSAIADLAVDGLLGLLRKKSSADRTGADETDQESPT